MKRYYTLFALLAAVSLNAATVDTNYTAGPSYTTDNSDASLRRIVNNTYKTATNVVTITGSVAMSGLGNQITNAIIATNDARGYLVVSNANAISATISAAGVTNVTGTTLSVVGNVGITNATAGLSTNGVVVTPTDGTGATGLFMYSDTGGANYSAPLIVFPMVYNGSTLDRWNGAVGFHSFVTNVDLAITNGTGVTNANYALGPEIAISGVSRINGRAVQLQNMCIITGTSNVLNIAGILITKAPEASWTSGAAIALDYASMTTNFMTFIASSTATSTNQVGTNYIIEWANIGKLIKPLTNSIFLHCVSAASNYTNANSSTLRIALSQD